MIYLASPYTHADMSVKEKRYFDALKCLAHFTNQGLVVFSPIVHSYPMEIRHILPGDWEFWKKVDEEFISRSDALWILCLEGWKQSTGVQAEFLIAIQHRKRVAFIFQDDYGMESYIESGPSLVEQFDWHHEQRLKAVKQCHGTIVPHKS